jgi:choline-phosphate cytidylyltransferase
MIKVITYGTYDLLHYGHIRLLERAKALGDYLIVGVTADGFDKARGKINVQQSLMERIEAVKATGLADEIVVEEYEGQKIDDIKRFDVDIFTVGSDWKGNFDYLNEFCKVVYLDRTEGVSSSEIRSGERTLRIGLVGELPALDKFRKECKFVNGATVSGVYSLDNRLLSNELKALPTFSDYQKLLEVSDAVFIYSNSNYRYEQVKQALHNKKHVLCESPLALTVGQWNELRQEANRQGVVLMESIKTAYSTAYYRLLLMVKSGIIGEVVSVDSICTSQSNLQMSKAENFPYIWNSMSEWGPTAMLPIFQLMGTGFREKIIATRIQEGTEDFDLFTKISFIYSHGVASMKIGQGVKSEGELVISGTEGYIYVPAPWWKTDYFEVRYENPANNKRYFYQLEGEGIRYEIVSFLKTIQRGTDYKYIDDSISEAIVRVMQDFDNHKYINI